VLEGRARLDGRPIRVLGIEPVSLPPGGALTTIGAEGPDDAGAILATPRRALASPETLAEWGLAEGARPVLNGAEGPVLQARPGLAAGTLVMDIGQAQEALDMPAAVSRLIAPARAAPDAAELDRLSGGLLTVSAQNPDADLARLTDSFHLNLTAFGLLSFVVGLFIAHAAAGLAFEQRRGVVRTLRACGAPARTVAAALLAETAALALAAGAVGMALGYLIAAALAPDVAASLRGLYGAPAAGQLTLSPLWWASGLGMALAGGLAATGAGVWNAAQMPVLAAAQGGAWAAAHRRRMRAQAAVAAALLAVAAALGAWGTGLAAGFALLATLLLGAALAAPPILSVILGLGAAQARSPVARWVWADARAALPGLSLALMALLLALATNIGVGAMVSSFRDTFTGWLDQRLAADIYARAPDDARAAALEAVGARTEGIAAVLPTLSAEARLGGWPVEIMGLADDPIYRDRWPFIAVAPDAWAAVAAGEGALVSEQLARRLGLSLGDTVAAPGADGPWPLRVVGVHPDYGNPKGQIVVGLTAMRARIPDAPRGAYAIRVEGRPVAEALGALAADPALQGVEMIDQTQVKRLSLGLFDQTFAVTGALNALTLGVAGAALFASLSTLSGMRLTQVAPLWAMGLTRARLARLEFLRVMALAAGTGALAIPLGVALAWALVAVLNVQAFGWRLPLKLYPLDWLVLGALAMAAAALAAAGPTLRLRRTPPARLLAAFAQER
jgi:putative ABC transport system permease protein